MLRRLAPSLLAADQAFMARDALAVRRGGAHLLHLDIMDGHFVPNLSFGPQTAACLSALGALPLDVHLMVEKPSFFAPPFIKAGAHSINVHVETETEASLKALLAETRALGVKTAVTIKPKTPPEALLPYLELVDMVLVMTVEPGFGGQGFLPGSLERIAAVRALIGNKIDLQVDGGVTLENAADCLRAGASVLVAGSSVFGAPDVEKRTKEFVALLAAEK